MIDVTKIVREITYNGTKIPLLGTGDNIIKVLTEAELNALLVPENVDKLVAYNGELYVIAEGESSTNAPIAAGDTIDKLYFNLSVEEPDFFTKLTYSHGIAQLVVNDYEAEGLHEGLLALDFNAMGDATGYGLGYLVFQGGTQQIFLYTTDDLPETAGFPQGFSPTAVVDGAFTLPASLTIATVNDQDLWGNFISKEPFGGNIIAKPIAGKLLSVNSNGDIVAEIITYAEEASF